MSFTIQNNTPSVGCIQWSSLSMVYKGVTYAITNGYTNAIYAYWTPAYPTNLIVTNTFPTLTADDCLIFLNKSGTATTVPTASVVPGDLIVPGSVTANAIAANTITGDKILAGTISTALIEANAISSDKIAANAIGADKIAANAIISDKIQGEAITADKIKAKSITANQILAGTISTAEIKANTIKASNIESGTITGTQIAAGSISTNKLSISNFNNFAELNRDNLYNFTASYDATYTNKTWYTLTTLARDTTISKTYTCNGGESFRIKFDLTTTVQGASVSGGASDGYKNVNVGIYGKTKSGANVYYIPAGSSNCTNTSVNVTATLGADVVSFYVAVQIGGYSPFSGSVEISDVMVQQMGTGELIVDGSIKSTHINTVGLDASTIKTGTIDANRLDANTIVSKVGAATTTISGDKITTGTIKSAHIETVGLDASTIKTGTIDANRLSANTIVSKVNAATTTISGDKITTGTISSGHIDVTGLDASTIKTGTIDATRLNADTIVSKVNAATTTISGDKITTGTISSGHIDTVGLDANTIKTGTINANRLDANTIVSKVNAATTTISGDKITTGTISSGHIDVTGLDASTIKTGTIDANRLNADTIVSKVNGATTTISGNKITTGTIKSSHIETAGLDANTIKTGTIDANRLDANTIVSKVNGATTTISGSKITTNSINAQQIAIGDYTNLSQINEEKNPNGNTVVTLNNTSYFKPGSAAYQSLSFLENTYVEFKLNDEYYIAWNGYRDAGLLGLTAILRYYYTDATYSNAGSISMLPTTTDTRMSATIKVTAEPTIGKIVNLVKLFVEKDSTAGSGYYYIRDIEIRKKYTGSLIVDGSIKSTHIDTVGLDASTIKTGTIDANRLDANTIVSKVGAATTTISGDKITSGTLMVNKVHSDFGKDLNISSNTSITLKANASEVYTKTEVNDAINNTRTMAKHNGIELLDLSYQKNIATATLPFALGTYTIVPASEIAGTNANIQNLIKVVNGQFLYSPYIACNPNGTQYVKASIYNLDTNVGTFYIQCCYYDKDKVSITTNESALSLIGGVSNTSANTWQTFEGYLDPLSSTDIRQKAVYMRIRALPRYYNQVGTTYIKDLTWKQLSAHTIYDIQTRLTSAEIKITDSSIISTVTETIESKVLESQNVVGENTDKAITEAQNLVLESVSQNYATAGDLQKIDESVTSIMEQTPKAIEMAFNTVDTYAKEVAGGLETYKEEVKTHIRFSDAGMELGKSNSEFTATLDNEKLAFKQNGEEIAYIGNNKLNITEAEIKDALRIGEAAQGFFTWTQNDVNGNLRLKWSDK